MEQFRKFDEEQNKFFLDEKYLFAFTQSDGFTERLLRAELVIDHDYNYVLELSAFNHEKKTKNNSNSFEESGKIPDKMRLYLENLFLSDYLALKSDYDYETICMTDVGMQLFLLNTNTIHIIDGLPAEYFESEVEKILFEFNDFLKTYIENKYQNWLK